MTSAAHERAPSPPVQRRLLPQPERPSRVCSETNAHEALRRHARHAQRDRLRHVHQARLRFVGATSSRAEYALEQVLPRLDHMGSHHHRGRLRIVLFECANQMTMVVGDARKAGASP